MSVTHHTNGNGRATRRPVPAAGAPHNLEAEESLLGAMLLSRDAIAEAVEKCSADDFYRPVHGHIFDAVCSLWGQGEPADPVTVGDELARAGLLEQAGGLAALLSLQSNTPASSNAGKYAGIVEDLAVRRRLIGAGGDVVQLGYENAADPLELVLDRAETAVFSVAQRKTTQAAAPLSVLLAQHNEALELLAGRDEHITGIPTGFVDLDALLLGLQPSSLVIVGARPSVGKSAFAMAIANHAALVAQAPVLFFSMEMSHKELMDRLLSTEARIDGTRIRNGRLSENDWERYRAARARLTFSQLHIDDTANVTLMDVRAKARRVQSKLGTPLGLIVIDYLQLMTPHHGAENRQVEISEISRGLKILARELDIPIVALSQLSRNLEARADKRPMLADLRESGSLEQDSDVVVFLFRNEIYAPNDIPSKGKAEVIVAKHRNGPTGTVHLAFLSQYARFANAARPPQ